MRDQNLSFALLPYQTVAYVLDKSAQEETTAKSKVFKRILVAKLPSSVAGAYKI